MALWYWRESLSWNYFWACLCILAAVFFVFRPNEPPQADTAVEVAADFPRVP
jgi:hypothetical protein